jgi:hypothetical protein
LASIATERSNVIVFPLPMDMLAPLLGRAAEPEKGK